jgi:hypothetical protein
MYAKFIVGLSYKWPRIELKQNAIERVGMGFRRENYCLN